MRKLILSFIALVVTVSLWALPTVKPIYVAPDGTGDGSSWESPMGSIAEALNAAKAIEHDIRPDVWVKGGTYLINSMEDRLVVVDSISIYASFAGTETSIDERAKVEGGKPWEFVNQTVIDGQGQWPLFQAIGQQDTANHEYFRYIDGLKFTNGSGFADSTSADWRAPVYARYGIKFRYCQSVGNVGYYAGGGFSGWPAYDILYCLVKDNRQYDDAMGGGGIVMNTSTFGMPALIEGCDVEGNISNVRGGGMNLQGEALITVRNCRIFNNQTTKDETGEYLKGGSIYNQGTTNSIIVNNKIYNNGGNVYITPRMFANNTVVKNYGQIYVAGANNTSTFANNIIWGLETSDGSKPTGIGSAPAELKAYNNASYHSMPEGKLWQVQGTILFSSNVSNGPIKEEDVKEGTCGSGPRFQEDQMTSFCGPILPELSPEDAAPFIEEMERPDLWKLTALSPCFNTGIKPMDTTMVITTTMVAGRPKRDTSYIYREYVLDDYVRVSRPQGEAYDRGCYEMPYFGMTLAYDIEKVMVMSETGEELNQDTVLTLVEGQNTVIYVINMTEDEMILTCVESSDGGKTYTGTATDVTYLISDEGLFSMPVVNNCQLQVTFNSHEGLKDVNANVRSIKQIHNGQFIIIRGNKQYNALGTEL